jgi:hypothetical protein
VLKVIVDTFLKVGCAIHEFNVYSVIECVVNDHKNVKIHAETDVCLTTIMVIEAIFLGSKVNEL